MTGNPRSLEMDRHQLWEHMIRTGDPLDMAISKLGNRAPEQEADENFYLIAGDPLGKN
jgi:hypothetical protein